MISRLDNYYLGVYFVIYKFYKSRGDSIPSYMTLMVLSVLMSFNLLTIGGFLGVSIDSPLISITFFVTSIIFNYLVGYSNSRFLKIGKHEKSEILKKRSYKIFLFYLFATILLFITLIFYF